MPLAQPHPEGVPTSTTRSQGWFPTTRSQGWLLGLLLLWSLAVRVFFSWPDPTMNRYWDERYNAGNVAVVLAYDQWRPWRTHYPSLSYLPHAATLKIYETARALPWLSSAPKTFGIAPDERPFLTPVAVRVCRIIQALLGTASLLVVFLIGRQLFGAPVGLGATFLLAVTPWHFTLSGFFKPDIMLVLTSLLALYAMLQVRRTESLRGYAVAGALVGATVAAKWNGAAVALPLLVTIALAGVGNLGLLLRRTAAAAAAGAAVLLALNPWLVLAPELYERHLGSTVSHYQERLAQAGAGLFDQPLNLATSLARSIYFSPVLGVCTLLGMGWILAVALRGWRRPGNRLRGARGSATIGDAWILLTFFGGYVAALWIVTRFPKPPNWLIVAPIAALAGAWFIGLLLNAARSNLAGWPRGAVLAVAAVVVALAAMDKVRNVSTTVYDVNVPLTTAEAARVAGEKKPLRGRTFISELPLGPQDFDPRIWDPNYVSTLIRTDSIASESRLEWEQADILLFHASRLDPGEDAFYRDLTGTERGVHVQRFEPRPFHLRGDPVVLVRQHFAQFGPPELLPFFVAGDGVYDVDLAGLRGAEGPEASSLSLEIAIRTPFGDTTEVALDIDGARLPCRHTQKGRNRRRCLTPRLQPPPLSVRVSVQPPREVIEVTAFRWRQPT